MQIISLLLEAGQINIAEILIKGLPASPLKVYHVKIYRFSKLFYTNQKRKKYRPFKNIKKF